MASRSRPPVSICVLDDDRLGLPRLAVQLKRLGFLVEAASTRPKELLQQVRRLLPAIAIVDVSHASADRLAALAELKRAYPLLRVVAVVDGPQKRIKQRCRMLGAWRCVHRTVAVSPAMARVLHAGAKRNEREVVRLPRLVARDLTPKEGEVLSEVAAGADNLQIGARLGIAERTVKVHVTSIYQKLGAQNRVQLALMARGILKPSRSLP